MSSRWKRKDGNDERQEYAILHNTLGISYKAVNISPPGNSANYAMDFLTIKLSPYLRQTVISIQIKLTELHGAVTELISYCAHSVDVQ